jgi:hypothetical protein
VLTVLAGLRLYQVQARSTPGWVLSRTGLAFGLGGALAIIAWVIGISVSRPSAAKLAALIQSLQAPGASPPSPEQQTELTRLRTRLGVATRFVAYLLLVTVVTMAVARYLV